MRFPRGAASAPDKFLPHQPRCQFLLGDDPRGIHALFGKIWVLAGNTLAPGGQSIGLDLDQQNAPRCGGAKAGLKGKGERHIDLA
jgi:hypothetical protein